MSHSTGYRGNQARAKKDRGLQLRVATNKKYKEEIIMGVSLITYEGKIYVPPCLTSETLN